MEGRDGVSLSYVMSVASLMFDVESYVSLPKGGGVSIPKMFLLYFASSLTIKIASLELGLYQPASLELRLYQPAFKICLISV